MRFVPTGADFAASRPSGCSLATAGTRASVRSLRRFCGWPVSTPLNAPDSIIVTSTRTRCDIVSRPTCWRPAQICARFRGAVFLGLLGLASGDFATTWQRVGPNVPFRVPLAYFTAFIELAAGLLLWRRTALAGALTLTVVYSVFTLVWVPKIIEGLSGYDPTGNFFEEFSLVAAGAVLFARFSPTRFRVAKPLRFFVQRDASAYRGSAFQNSSGP
jgi:hypothetical protein